MKTQFRENVALDDLIEALSGLDYEQIACILSHLPCESCPFDAECTDTRDVCNLSCTEFIAEKLYEGQTL